MRLGVEIIDSGPDNKSREDVDVLRRLSDELVELCHGNAIKGIEGWRECWNGEFIHPLVVKAE
jgi:hypothetical protein